MSYCFLLSFSGNRESDREPNAELLECHTTSGLSLFNFFLGRRREGLTTVLAAAPEKEKWAVFYKWSDCRTKIEWVFFTPKVLLHN